MRFLKSAAIRAIALLLFFAMIAAVVLYQAGAYDIVFIKRPLPNVAPETETDGLFVAGDCRTKNIRQISTACGDGATAALAACRYLD